MKIEMINSDQMSVFVSKFYFKGVDFDKKIELISMIKELISKIDTRYKLNLNGFYKIKVYPNSKIGAFLDIIKIDDNEFSSGADFRIVVYPNEKFYLETEDYESLDFNVEKRYYDHKFYIDLDDIKDMNQLIDMGTIIYGSDVKKMICYSKIIK